jgi:hypothetical protein
MIETIRAKFPVGTLVTVRGPFQMGEREGQGFIGVDAWTGRTMKVFGVSRDDLELGDPADDEYEVAIHHGRCTPVERKKA